MSECVHDAGPKTDSWCAEFWSKPIGQFWVICAGSRKPALTELRSFFFLRRYRSVARYLKKLPRSRWEEMEQTRRRRGPNAEHGRARATGRWVEWVAGRCHEHLCDSLCIDICQRAVAICSMPLVRQLFGSLMPHVSTSCRRPPTGSCSPRFSRVD